MLGAGTELVVCVLGGLGAGYWLDGRLKTAPWLMLLGVFGGIALGLYELIRIGRGRR